MAGVVKSFGPEQSRAIFHDNTARLYGLAPLGA